PTTRAPASTKVNNNKSCSSIPKPLFPFFLTSKKLGQNIINLCRQGKSILRVSLRYIYLRQQVFAILTIHSRAAELLLAIARVFSTICARYSSSPPSSVSTIDLPSFPTLKIDQADTLAARAHPLSQI
ncbi:hypothetical protein CPAR01_03587, partial [Colletotrichum paranaense]